MIPSSGKSLVFLIGLFSVLFLFDMPGTPLFDPDETRYAEIPREMNANQDYLTPRLNGSHYFEKPPLLYWLNAASFKLLGETPFAAHLPVRLASLGVVLLLMLGFSKMIGREQGMWAALIYLTGVMPFVVGRINLTDGVLNFFLTAAFFSLLGFLQAEERREKTMGWQWALGSSIGLAVLTKGLIGVVFPAAVCCLWIAIHRQWRLIPRILFSWIPIVALVLAAPWFILMEKAHAGFSYFFFIHEHFQRYATPIAMREAPIYFFTVVFLMGLFPWSVPFVQEMIGVFKGKKSNLGLMQGPLFFMLWFFVILIFFTLSHSKLVPYILPLFPAAAVITAQRVVRQSVHRQLMWKRGLLVWAGVLLGVVFTIPRIAHRWSEYNLAEIARDSAVPTIVGFGWYPQSFPWILKRPIPVVDFQGELASDNIKSEELFWSSEKFWAIWFSDQPILVSVQSKKLDTFLEKAGPSVTIMGKNHRSVLVRNFKPT
jgi:4-amino-4-deoxy-L-arabinose transferase-like glycosyltransferase